jgi:hypothetical protein
MATQATPNTPPIPWGPSDVATSALPALSQRSDECPDPVEFG